MRSSSVTAAASVTADRGAHIVCRRRFSLQRLLLYVLLVGGSLVMLLPLAWLVRSSFMEVRQIFAWPPAIVPSPATLSNYQRALESAPFARYALNTLLIEALVVSGTLVSASASAYSFARLRWPGRDLVFGLLLTAMMLPYAVTLIPTFVMWQHLGVLNSYVPLTVPAWFGGGAFNLFVLRQFFRTIPRDLDEAAFLDGATPLQVLWYVILPLSRPALTVVGVLTFIAVWNDFLGPIIYLRDQELWTLSVGLASFKGLYNAQWGPLMAAAAMVTAPIIVLFLFAQRYLVQGIQLTGMKG
jgi:multiple sugar transport system permease protein